jgi:hypothetical protein
MDKKEVSSKIRIHHHDGFRSAIWNTDFYDSKGNISWVCGPSGSTER